jgi:predicted ATP-grasp superfamily ATP-dependent carboligase
MAQQINILIPDGESTFAPLLIPCFQQMEGAHVHILSTKKKNPIKYSCYIKSFQLIERNDDWLKQIQGVVNELNIDMIVPVTEEVVRFFIQHQHEFENTNIIALPSLESFDIGVNKQKLNTFCLEHGVMVPKSYVVNEINSTTFNLSSIQYPVLIKPLISEGGGGIVRLDTKQLLGEYIKASKIENHFIQEYINGYDIDCSVLCKNGTIVTHTIQRGNLLASSPYKQQLGVHFLNNENVLKEVATLMKALNWSGIAHVDLRYDKKTNTYKVIEINARFWGSILASLNVGVNFPKLLIELSQGKNVEFQNYKKEEYLQLKGLFKLFKQKPLMLFKFKYIFNNTDVKYAFKDPLPTIYKDFYWLQRIFFKPN